MSQRVCLSYVSKKQHSSGAEGWEEVNPGGTEETTKTTFRTERTGCLACVMYMLVKIISSRAQEMLRTHRSGVESCTGREDVFVQ